MGSRFHLTGAKDVPPVRWKATADRFFLSLQKTCFMNFIEELRWKGMIHDMMPGTEEILAGRDDFRLYRIRSYRRFATHW